MKVEHEIANRKFESDLFANLLLTNKIGGFFNFSIAPFSKYSGYHFCEDNEVYKTIESIKLTGAEQITRIKNDFTTLKINRGNPSSSAGEITETIFLPQNKNSLCYEHNSRSAVEINLDCRKAYDGKTWGRYYNIAKEKIGGQDIIIIKYSKKKDEKEDGIAAVDAQGEQIAEYEIYAAIVSDNNEYELINKWYDQFYPFDFERNEQATRAIYQSIRLNAKNIAIGFSTNKEKAIEEAKNLYDNKTKLIEERKEEIALIKHKKIKEKSIDFAYLSTMNAMNSFLINKTDSLGKNGIAGIYAGYPWFFQYWTRDTCLSSKALYLSGKIVETKTILLRYLDSIREDGWIFNRLPHADLDSADAVGLVFFRLSNLIDYLEDKELLVKHFTEDELKMIKVKLETAIYAILKNHSQNDFIINKRKETWMDTDDRSGVRIEIQALQLSMYAFLRRLSKRFKDEIAYNFAIHQEKTLLKKIRTQLFDKDKKFLQDGLDDKTIRPNVFLAYYIYPSMLSKKEWESTFDLCLDKLWLPWGGLSTIDKNNFQFQKRHTGSTDASYHKGDAWYFLNNLSAISLYRLDKDKYQTYVDKILEASTTEIVQRGILGFHAEVSSAEVQESKGCLAQAWSSAFYIELVREILGD